MWRCGRSGPNEWLSTSNGDDSITTQKPAGGKSALLVAKDGGRVVGCVGLETRVVRDGQVTKLESLKGDTPGASLQPVIANLAVDRRCVLRHARACVRLSVRSPSCAMT